MPLKILTVLYNKNIEDIASLENFLDLQARGASFIVSDNSTDEQIKKHNADVARTMFADRLTYLDNGGNVGLSKAYNRVLPEIRDGDYLMLTDDDTFFSSEYLSNVIDEIEKKPSVITGIVRTDGGIMSPIRRFVTNAKKNDFIDQPGDYFDIYAINSGLVLAKDIIDAFGRFPDELFLDMIDYWLMDTLIILGRNKITVVDGDIRQNFSGEKGYSKALKSRFAIYKRDVKAYSRLIPHRRFKCAVILLKRRLSILKKRISKRG